MQQQFEDEAQQHGYKPDEYREILRRAQRIRADKEERLSSDALAESAAEVGIREEDLRAAAEEIRQEQALRAQQSRTRKIAAAIAAAVLALVLLFSYNSLNSASLAVDQARGNLQSTLQRRADVVSQLTPLVREAAATDQRLVGEVGRLTQQLRSGDVAAQLAANQALSGVLSKVEGSKGFEGSAAYRDMLAEISGSENRINVARTRYNAAVTDYNRSASSFPAVLVRPLLGFPGNKPVFEASSGVGNGGK
jgi:LemA protein